MNVCPFCKSAVRDPHAPCTSCGRRASEHPSLQTVGGGRTLESGWGDDEIGELDLSRGGAIGSHSGPSAYAGGGLSLGDDDDPFADDVPQGAIELDLPAHPASARSLPAGAVSGVPPAVPDLAPPGPGSNPSLPAAPRSAPGMPAVAPSPSDPAIAAPPSPSDPAIAAPPSPSDPAIAPPQPAPAAPVATPRQAPDFAALIARFPPPPDKLWEAPVYAMKVLLRQMELREDLASLRKKRSPDVPLYERALRTHDTKTFTLGIVLTCAGVAIAGFVFFLPVILRFLWEPD